MSLSLFKDYPVTEAEVQEWLDQVPNLSAARWRREAYRKAYNVEEKIRAAKMAAEILPNQSQSRSGTP